MTNNRITKHPILNPQNSRSVSFTWNSVVLEGQTTDTIASALIANGIHIFGHHPKDGSPQGIFCANGQCAQCTVLVNGIPQKACMTPLLPDMIIQELNQIPDIPTSKNQNFAFGSVIDDPINCQVLIIGGGPAGLSAAITLGQHDIDTILIDDKQKLGGKLVLQTHRFFGSAEEVHAGKRGIEIAEILETEVRTYPSVKIWNASRAIGVFADHKVGVVNQTDQYTLIDPEILLVATGARENSLIFPGNTLPGVFGAGAFQTLLNRDMVKPANNLFIVGGGNVGLITAYHALQAGINVIGLIEAAPRCGGYQVHELKLARLGVPILTSHTILAANGTDHVESITIAQCDDHFQPITATQQTFLCDAILVAVGLSPVNEFTKKALEFGMTVYSAGDAEEIAEASAAMIAGKIKAAKILNTLHIETPDNIQKLETLAEKLRTRPGEINPQGLTIEYPVIQPIIHCNQEIPCNPCSISCPLHNIKIPPENILAAPFYQEDNELCLNCERCLTICPGLAITIIDTRTDPDMAIVSIPFEFDEEILQNEVMLMDELGNELQKAQVMSIQSRKSHDHTKTVKVKVPIDSAYKVAGIKIQENLFISGPEPDSISNETIICRCERVSAGEIRALIRVGITDINQIKAITRAGMGACGAKTCHSLILRLFREEGIAPQNITPNTDRPLFYETELGILAGTSSTERNRKNDRDL